MENKKVFKNTLKILLFSVLIGLSGGVLGTLFSKCIALVTGVRSNNSWLIYFLPIAGFLIVFIYDKLKVTGVGTNQVIKNCTGETKLSPLITPAIFVCSAISHLFGASVGREGAALQLGGGLTSLFERIFKLEDEETQILTYCGMAALFSAVFGTPIAAFIFALQIVFVWKIRFKAVVPTFVSSLIAYSFAVLLGSHPERFHIGNIPNFSGLLLLSVVSFSVLCGLVAMFFCYSIEWCEKLFKKLFKNAYLRVAAGGIVTVVLTLLVKCNDYNGAGVNIIEKIFEAGEFKPEAFFVKMVFTCIAVAAGYKGGEIVPTLFIGATFGALLASIVGLPVAFGAVIGMTALFCGVTNCPLAAIALSLEMFSGKCALYIIIASIISFFVSGNISLYSAQKPYSLKQFFKFSKKSLKNT